MNDKLNHQLFPKDPCTLSLGDYFTASLAILAEVCGTLQGGWALQEPLTIKQCADLHAKILLVALYMVASTGTPEQVMGLIQEATRAIQAADTEPQILIAQ